MKRFTKTKADTLPGQLSDYVGKDVGSLGERLLEEKVHWRRAALLPVRLVFGLVGNHWEVEPSGEFEIQSQLHPADALLFVWVRLLERVGDPVEVLEDRLQNGNAIGKVLFAPKAWLQDQRARSRDLGRIPVPGEPNHLAVWMESLLEGGVPNIGKPVGILGIKQGALRLG